MVAFNPDTMYYDIPCKYGHDGLRYKNNRGCVHCALERGKRWYRENKDLKKAYDSTQKRKDHQKAYHAKPEIKERERKRKHEPYHRQVQIALNRKRYAAKLQRIPKWANLEAIEQFYINCPSGMVVDHIIPLQGKLVSGFHVENNLQYLTSEENCHKNNLFNLY